MKTPLGFAERALGGSANYFGVAASMFAPVRVVGVVGEDYSDSDTQMLVDKGVDISGIERVKGKTFHWEGVYSGDMNEAKTIKTDLNVFEHFHPKLPANFQDTEYVFLANIDPVLQAEVLNQVKKPRVVAADTMNFWINSKLPDLKKIIKNLDILIINEGEAKLLTGAGNGVAAAARIADMGPKTVVIKRGEYGFMLYVGGHYFALPAFPVPEVVDPTGAGDTFAGGFMGYLAKFDLGADLEAVKMAAVYGTLLASFTVQDFSLGALKNLTLTQVEQRHLQFRQVVSIDA